MLEEWKDFTPLGGSQTKQQRNLFNGFFDWVTEKLNEAGATPQDTLPEGEAIYPITDDVLMFRAITRRSDGKPRKVRYGDWQSFTTSPSVLKSDYYGGKGLHMGVVIVARTKKSLHIYSDRFNEHEVVSRLMENDVVEILPYKDFEKNYE